MAEKEKTVFSDYYFLRLLDVFDIEGTRKLIENYPEYARYLDYLDRVALIGISERGKTFRDIKTNDTFSIMIMNQPRDVFKTLEYEVCNKTVGTYMIKWDSVGKDEREVDGHYYNVGKIKTYFNSVYIKPALFFEALSKQELPNIPSYFNTWEDVLRLVDGIECPARLYSNIEEDGNYKEYKDLVLRHEVIIKKKKATKVSDLSNGNSQVESITVTIGDLTYKFVNGKYYINDEQVEEKEFVDCYDAKKIPDKTIKADNQHQSIPNKEKRFNTLAFIKELEAMSGEEITREYGQIITGKQSKVKDISQKRTFVNPSVGEMLIIEQHEYCTKYTVLTIRGNYSIAIWKDDGHISTFFDNVLIDQKIFFEALEKNEIPNVEPIFRTWDDVLNIDTNTDNYAIDRLSRSNGSSTEDDKTYSVYTDNLLGHKIEKSTWKNLKEGRVKEIKAYIGDIIYCYYSGWSEKYSINGEEVSQEAFVANFNAKSESMKTLRQSQPLTKPKEES